MTADPYAALRRMHGLLSDNQTPEPNLPTATGNASRGTSPAPAGTPYTTHPDPVMEQWVRDNEVKR